MADALVQDEKTLARIANKDPSLYRDISLAALTVYSLYWLHSWQLRRTIEAVSVLNWRLFPEKFAMVGFIEYPDAFRTNRSLLQGQPKYRNWLTGSATKGFSLNERGMDVARQLIAQLGPPATIEGDVATVSQRDEPATPSPERARSVEPEHVVRAARESRLFEKWKSGLMSERDLIHVHSLLGVFDHTPAKLRNKLMRDLERSASDVHDDEIKTFLIEVRRLFPSVFASRGS